MQGWFEFYAVIGGASATLMGLLFVAISVNAAAILGGGHKNSRHLAGQAFQNFIVIILTALLALFPDITLPHFGLAVLVLAGLSTLWLLFRLYLAITRPAEHEGWRYTLRRYLNSLIGFALLIYAGLRMAAWHDDQRNMVAAATLVLLFSATLVAWELLLTLARVKDADL